MKRTIKITESQFKKLIEANSPLAPNFDNGDVKEYLGSEVTTTSNVTDSEGVPQYGKQPTADELQNTMAIQNFWANTHKGIQRVR